MHVTKMDNNRTKILYTFNMSMEMKNNFHFIHRDTREARPTHSPSYY